MHEWRFIPQVGTHDDEKGNRTSVLPQKTFLICSLITNTYHSFWGRTEYFLLYEMTLSMGNDWRGGEENHQFKFIIKYENRMGTGVQEGSCWVEGSLLKGIKTKRSLGMNSRFSRKCRIISPRQSQTLSNCSLTEKMPLKQHRAAHPSPLKLAAATRC